MSKHNDLHSTFPWRYFLLTYLFSWLIWSPGVLATQKGITLPIPNMVLVGLGAFGPLAAALILTHLEKGKAGVKELLLRAVQWKFKKIWLIPTFLLLPLLIGGAFGIYILLHGTDGIPSLQLLSQPWLIIPSFIAALLILGALQEEFGWRGYALDRLQSRWNALVSSLILGTLWAIWHLPLFFIEGTSQSHTSFILFFLGTLEITIIYTWLYNNTGGSILIPLLFHAMHNTSFNLFPLPLLPSPDKAFLYLIILQGLAAATIIMIWGPERLTRRSLPTANENQQIEV